MTAHTSDEEQLIDAEAYAFAYGVSVSAALGMMRASAELERLEGEYCAKSPLPRHEAVLEFYETPEAAELYATAEPRRPRSKPVQTELSALYMARASLLRSPGYQASGKVTAAQLVTGGLTLLSRLLSSTDPERRAEAHTALFDEGDAD